MNLLEEHGDIIALVLSVVVSIAVCVGSLYGWGHNIALLSHSAGMSWMVALRIIGVPVIPIGIVMGYVS